MKKGKGLNEYINVTGKEYLILTFKSAGVVIILDYFFYKSLWALIFLSVIGFVYFKKGLKELLETKRNKARTEFKEMLILTGINQRAGYSTENALKESYPDLKGLYGEDGFCCRLLKKIETARRNNTSIAEVFLEVGRNSEVSDVEEFGEIYRIAYEKSGNVSSVMDKAAKELIEKLELKEEILRLLNEKVFEMKIMSAMPFLIILYISLTDKGYFDPLYHSLFGIVTMSFCLLIYLAAYSISCSLVKFDI